MISTGNDKTFFSCIALLQGEVFLQCFSSHNDSENGLVKRSICTCNKDIELKIQSLWGNVLTRKWMTWHCLLNEPKIYIAKLFGRMEFWYKCYWNLIALFRNRGKIGAKSWHWDIESIEVVNQFLYLYCDVLSNLEVLDATKPFCFEGSDQP